MLRPFAYRNYRLFGGQILSLVGSWISMTATSWLCTGSPDRLSCLASSASPDNFSFVAPFAGAYLDRWDRHRVLVVTQTCSMVQSFARGAHADRHITVQAVIALSAIQGR